MQPRLKLDIGWIALLSALFCRGDEPADDPYVVDDLTYLPALSVRTLFQRLKVVKLAAAWYSKAIIWRFNATANMDFDSEIRKRDDLEHCCVDISWIGSDCVYRN